MDWMVVYTTNDLTDAHIVAGRLQVEGIKTFIHRSTFGSVYGITYGTAGETSVVVNPEDYERALAILEPDEVYSLSDDNEEIIYYSDQDDEDDSE